jgi:hypothetical protein
MLVALMCQQFAITPKRRLIYYYSPAELSTQNIVHVLPAFVILIDEQDCE